MTTPRALDIETMPAGVNLPSVVNAFVETPKGCRNKFEIDKRTGFIRLDRYLFASSHYPGDYGFVPSTLADDGDALDILIIVNEPTFSGCLIEARVLGLFRMRDHGADDFKILGVPPTDPLFESYKGLADVPQPFLREVEHFFQTYKELEGVKIETLGWGGVEEAFVEVEASVKRYQAHAARVA